MSRSTLLNHDCTLTVPTEGAETDRAGLPIDGRATFHGRGYFEQKQADDQTGTQTSDEQRWLALLWLEVTGDDTSGDTYDLVDLMGASMTIDPDGLGSFAVVGEPWPVRNPRTRQVEHVECEMRRVSGGRLPAEP